MLNIFQLAIHIFRTNYTACAATTRWAYRFAALVVVRLRSALSPLWVNIGTSRYMIGMKLSLYIYLTNLLLFWFSALRMRQMREAFLRPSSLREAWFGILRNTLSPIVRQFVLRLQSSHSWRW